jgi:hypothetical protein
MKSNKLGPVLTFALLSACMLNACDQAKSPDQVAKDTAAAETAAAQDTAKVEEKANDKVAGAQTVVRDEKAAEAHTRAVESEKVNDAEAAGTHKVALADCEKLGGEAQKACRAQADTAYDTAIAQARQAKADTDPKP